MLFDIRYPAVANGFDLRVTILGAPLLVACRIVPLSNNIIGGQT